MKRERTAISILSVKLDIGAWSLATPVSLESLQRACRDELRLPACRWRAGHARLTGLCGSCGGRAATAFGSFTWQRSEHACHRTEARLGSCGEQPSLGPVRQGIAGSAPSALSLRQLIDVEFGRQVSRRTLNSSVRLPSGLRDILRLLWETEKISADRMLPPTRFAAPVLPPPAAATCCRHPLPLVLPFLLPLL